MTRWHTDNENTSCSLFISLKEQAKRRLIQIIEQATDLLENTLKRNHNEFFPQNSGIASYQVYVKTGAQQLGQIFHHSASKHDNFS